MTSQLVSDRPRPDSSPKRTGCDSSTYESSSSKEDQSSAPRHRSSKPSGALSDQDQPQHDPDPEDLFKSQLVKEGEDFLLKKGTSKDSQGFGSYQNKPFCGPHNKNRGSYRKRPYGGNSSQSSNQSFNSGRGKPNFRGSGGRFRPPSSGRGRGNPSRQSLLKSLPRSTCRRSPPFFQKRLANKQMFIQHVKHYHQWLRSPIHFKTKSGQISSDSFKIQGPSKRSSSGLLYPVSSVKERNRNLERVENVKSLGFYSRLFLVPRPHQRWRPVIDLSTRRKVQNGNSRVHQDLPDSKGMGIVDRPVGRLPSHPHPPKLKEIPKVLPQVFQFTSLPFGLATAPQVFTSEHSGLYK